MNFNKKAGSEMWWIIIGAVIALIVLIILLVMFTGKTGGLEKGLSDCSGKGGVCVSVSREKCPVNSVESSTFSCEPGTEKKCCVGLPKKAKNGKCDTGEDVGDDNYCYPQS